MSKLTQRTLFTSPLLSVTDCRCTYDKANDSSRQEFVSEPEIVFLRRGFFVVRSGRDEIALSSNHALLLHPAKPYSVLHPLPGGDDCTVIGLGAGAIERFARTLEQGAGRALRASSGAFLLHYQLLAAAANGEEKLAVEERGAAVIESTLDSEQVFDVRASMAAARHRSLVNSTVELLSSALGEPLSLTEIAKELATSPFHLTRLFKMHTGWSLHRFRTLLRLRSGIDRMLLDDDLSDIALDLGFSDHSHFTTTFRKEFGFAPTQVRKQILIALRQYTAERIRCHRLT